MRCRVRHCEGDLGGFFIEQQNVIQWSLELLFARDIGASNILVSSDHQRRVRTLFLYNR